MSIYVTAVHITAYFLANLYIYYANGTKDRGTITGQRNFSRGYVIFTSIFVEQKAPRIRVLTSKFLHRWIDNALN